MAPNNASLRNEQRQNGGSNTTAPGAVNVGDYLQYWVTQQNTPQGQAQIKLLQAQMVAGGLLGAGKFMPGFMDQATQQALLGVMNQVSAIDSGLGPGAQATGTATVMGYIQAQVQSNAKNPKTSTSEVIKLTDPETAKALLRNALVQYTGELPTDMQVAQFTGALNAAEQANPQITSTTVNPNSIDPLTGGPTTKGTTVSGGLGTDPYRTGQTHGLGLGAGATGRR
jgi:hypothetical protein